MTLILKQVELANFRSHEQLKFEPSTTGITAISGPNGSGKSTLVDSVAWVLFGVKPAGVPKASALIRDGVDVSKEKCFAVATLVIDDGEIKVKRRIVNKTGAVECDVWERTSASEEFEHKAGPGVSHAEPYIKKRLKMDEKGFLSAVFVQQKQVDQLITAKAADRALVIERLTGIASITTAIAKAKEEQLQNKRALSDNAVDSTKLAALELEAEDSKERLTKVEERLSQGAERLQLLKGVAVATKKQLQEAESNTELYERLIIKKAAAEAGLEPLTEELQEALALKEERGKELEGTNTTETLEELEGTIHQEERKLQRQEDLKQAAEEAEAERLALQAQVASVLERLSVKGPTEAAEKLAAQLQLQGESTARGEAALQAKLAEVNEARGQLPQFRKAIATITGGKGECPTCLQRVDDVAAAVASLEASTETLEARVKSLQEEEGRIREGLERLRRKGEQTQSLLIQVTAAEAATKRASLAAEEAVKAQAEILVLEKRLKQLRGRRSSLAAVDALLREHKAVTKRVNDLSDRRESLLRQLNTAEEGLKGLNIGGDLGKLREKYSKAADEYQELVEKRSGLTEQQVRLQERLEALEQRIILAKKEEKRYASLLQENELAVTTVELLQAFKEERVKHAVPSVNLYASDLISRFTEGKFTALELDSKFNATVTLANGKKRPVGLLSGGELSAAAIALRIAISLLLNSASSNNSLILDEVFTAQDAERVEAILTAISEVCKGQLVIISHGPNTNEIADRVVQLA